MNGIDDLSLFSLGEIVELRDRARGALRVFQKTVAELSPSETPGIRLLQIEDLQTKIRLYNAEIEKRSRATITQPEMPSNPSVHLQPASTNSDPAPSSKTDVHGIADLLVTKWLAKGGSSDSFFADFIDRAELPVRLRMEARGLIHDDPAASARRLVRWALETGIAADDPKHTVLGRLLFTIVDELGMEQQRDLIATIVVNRMFLDPSERLQLAEKYGVPMSVQDIHDQTEHDTSGLFQDQITSDSELSVQLQSWINKPEPFYDVSFLAKAVECSAAVCQVDVAACNRTGTAFLVGSKSILTNYHVLRQQDDENVLENAQSILVRFGYIADGLGQSLQLDREHPVLASSPIGELDFALLQLDRAPPRINPLDANPTVPQRNDDLQILQHPYGGPMKVALSSNAVVKTMPEIGKLQYVTRAAGGASGAPCFDRAWRVVGIHRAERAKGFGAVREGILLYSVMPRVRASIV